MTNLVQSATPTRTPSRVTHKRRQGRHILAWSAGLPIVAVAAYFWIGWPWLSRWGATEQLLSIDGAQWWVLRRHVQHAEWWIVANAVAWPFGVAAPVVTLSLAPDGTPLMAMIALGIMSGVMMGFAVGALTGVVLMRLVCD